MIAELYKKGIAYAGKHAPDYLNKSRFQQIEKQANRQTGKDRIEYVNRHLSKQMPGKTWK